MVNIHGKSYEEVKDRIAKLRATEGYSILTWCDWHNEDFSKCVFGCEIQKDGRCVSTGFAYEERVEKASEVNFTSWVENCETSAIGRALANLGFGGTEVRPSVEEMEKVERMKGKVVKPKAADNSKFLTAMVGVSKAFDDAFGPRIGAECWKLFLHGRDLAEIVNREDQKEIYATANSLLDQMAIEAKRICGVHGTDTFTTLNDEAQNELLVPCKKLCLLA